MRSVFVSYRRGDSEGQARSLNFELVNLIGKDSVFMDVDSIALGRDFRHILHERLESCDLMLALIGPGWLDAKDTAGNRRLESATDLIRLEIAAALKRNIPVIPVLLQGAQMPPPERLPDDIKDLVYRNGFELGHSTWESDVREMVKRLGLDKEPAAPAKAPNEAQANPVVLTVSRPFKTSWVLATFVLIAIVAAVLFYYGKAHDQSSGSEIAASFQQPARSAPQQPEESAPRQPAGYPPQQGPAKQAPTSSNEKAIPDWVPVYPFAEQENILVRRGGGSLAFETENAEQHVRGAYATKLQAAGWKVATGYDGGYWAAGTSPDQRRSLAAVADRQGSKTRVAVSFLDRSLTSSGELSPSGGIPNWVPIYPGKVDNIRNKDNVGGFSVTTTHSDVQVRGLYAAILRASGYEVTTGYDGGYFARGTAKSQGYSIAATADTKDKVTNVLVLFEYQKKQQAP